MAHSASSGMIPAFYTNRPKIKMLIYVTQIYLIVKQNVNVNRTKYFRSFYATLLHNHDFICFKITMQMLAKLYANKASGKSSVASEEIVLRIRSVIAHCAARCTQLNRPSTTDCQFKIITTSIELHFT